MVLRKKSQLSEIKHKIEKFKPKKIVIQGEVRLRTYSEDGVEKIKNTLMKIEKLSDTLTLFYLGAGRYKLIIGDLDYKSAEKTLKKVQVILDKFSDKLSTVIFEREKIKKVLLSCYFCK